jgi:hypothetical protein
MLVSRERSIEGEVNPVKEANMKCRCFGLAKPLETNGSSRTPRLQT